ncbi:hypothetical protein [Escherichia phage vB_EcoM-Ro121c4YLVW]|uniref:Uncharacterized protein n=1 Tax=Escherichia phage vB_EcoM-Ro121c4YLVW TaxID=2144176 RepID=A0A499Q405_9CAUD|nr:hypothetical protein JR319_gp137 [Escherichia phage vB_EcoM-Ro121c4YLVW]AVZ45476.1 hypothetical protein [Escherichia phage vB_EcoM-Ro121c4YLVW]
MKTEIIIEIINGYKEAFIFAESARDHEGNFIDDMTDYEFSDQAHQRIIRDVAAFCDANNAAISEAMSDGATANQIGNDLHFTRNSHGVGFWDRPEIYTTNTANRLTNAAKFMPNVSAYIGEDNLIYIE